MQKYWLLGLVIIAVVFSATFLLLSSRNDPEAEAGPAPIVELTIRDDGFAPDPLVLPAGRLVELRVTNESGRRLVVTSEAEGIDQLPVETDLFNPTGTEQQSLNITVAPGLTTAVLIRFAEEGTYEADVVVPGSDAAVRVLTLRVE